jgi:glycosyltransferase involved in cell wall biosynthesis
MALQDMGKISVCIATYNGAKYIIKQLDSILPQLGESDEVVISDDSSSDGTLELIEELNDPRIRIIRDQKFRNPIFNFENAMLNAKGDFIFLSDQDDLWMPDKIAVVLAALKESDLVLTDCTVIDSKDEVVESSFFVINNTGRGFFKNLYSNSYLGCCLAMRREVIEKATPFPKDTPMHDWWIGMVSEVFFRITIIPRPLIQYRRHGLNATTTGGKSDSSLLAKFRYRYALLKGLLKIYIR